jgi:drug/metabolite transporter (DMT)-like permease
MVITLALLLISLVFASIAQLLFKIGMDKMGELSFTPISAAILTVLRIVTAPDIIFGIFFMLLSGLFWFIVLSRAELSFAYPMISLSYIMVALLSYFYLGEQISLVRWVAIIIIILGVAILARS